jgi:sialic acid synthase SpsE
LSKVYYIAEIGLNHNGDLILAKEMIDAAKDCGANAVKFQSIKAEKLVSPKTFTNHIDGFGLESVKTVGDFWKKVSISKDFHIEISNCCKNLGIEFISTPFDFESVDILYKLGVKRYKIASGDLTHYPLLEYVAIKKKPVILSTGASTVDEIGNAVKHLNNAGCDELTLLHCVSLYPTPADKANLYAIAKLRSKFNIPIGFSDHTLGFHISLAAIAMGATVIEKHFTIDKNLPGPDQIISADPEEFNKIVDYGNKIYNAIKEKDKVLTEDEIQMAKVIRRSIVASRNLKTGHKIKPDDLDYKRPGKGISPRNYRNIIGKKLKCAVKKDEMIKTSDIQT